MRLFFMYIVCTITLIAR